MVDSMGSVAMGAGRVVPDDGIDRRAGWMKPVQGRSWRLGRLGPAPGPRSPWNRSSQGASVLPAGNPDPGLNRLHRQKHRPLGRAGPEPERDLSRGEGAGRVDRDPVCSDRLAARRRECRDIRDLQEGVGCRAVAQRHRPCGYGVVAPCGASNLTACTLGRDAREAVELAGVARDVCELQRVHDACRPGRRRIRGPARPTGPVSCIAASWTRPSPPPLSLTPPTPHTRCPRATCRKAPTGPASTW